MADAANIPVEQPGGNDQIPISIIDLHIPDPEKVVDVLKSGLRMNFQNVEVKWIQCPNLRMYGLIAAGLCGNPALLELGSPSYLFPQPRPEKTYYFKDILRRLNRTNQTNLIIGAGKHTDPRIYDLAELFTNLMLSPMNPLSPNESMCLRDESYALYSLAEDANISALRRYDLDPMCFTHGNFFLSEGKPGKVLKINASYRIGPLSFVSTIQEHLKLMQTEEDPLLIGLGGMFRQSGAPSVHHIMPGYSWETNLNTMEQVQQWLRYRKLFSPLTAVGTILSEDSYICPNAPQFEYLTKSHFHSYTFYQPRGYGGHFYTDWKGRYTKPYTFYSGFFSFAKTLYCVDIPPSRTDIHTNIDNFYSPCQNFNIAELNITEEYI